MATKLYLRNTTNTQSGTFPTGEISTDTPDLSWTNSGTLRMLSTTAGSSMQTWTQTTNATSAAQTHFIGQWVSLPLATTTAVGGGTLTFNCASSENNAAANFFIRTAHVYIWRPSTGTKVGTVHDVGTGTSYSGALEATSTSSIQVDHSTATSVAVTPAVGDVIVVEVWATFSQTNGTARSVQFVFDGATENTTENAVVTDHASFINFTETFTFNTSSTYNNTGSGGVLAGSTAGNTANLQTSPSGGSLAGGAATRGVNFATTTASGGTLAAGTSSFGVSTLNTATGGTLAGSSALNTVQTSFTASGGELAGSSAITSTGFNVTATGGTVCGGSATNSVTIPGNTYSETGSGGVTVQPVQLPDPEIWIPFDGPSSPVVGLVNSIDGTTNIPLSQWAYDAARGKDVPTFDDVDDYVVTSAAAPITDLSVTLSVWFYPTAAGVIVTEYGEGSLGSPWHDSQIELVGTDVKLRVWNSGTSYSVGTANMNAWNHVVLRYDIGTTTLDGCLNGVFASTSVSVSRALGGGPFYSLGAAEGTNLGDGSAFGGKLDDFRMFNEPLTNAQILALWNGTTSAKVSAAHNPTSTGGSLVGSSADSFKTTEFTSTGGMVVGSSADSFKLIEATSTGGTVAGGSATEQAKYIEAGSGGLVAAGDSTNEAKFNVSVQARGVLSGSSASVETILTASATGGTVVGGSAESEIKTIINATGGVTASGTASVNFVGSIEVSGGVEVSGEAEAETIDLPGFCDNPFAIELEDGDCLDLEDGSGQVEREYTPLGSCGCNSFTITPSGGVTLGGSATVTSTSVSIDGGVSCSGSAFVELANRVFDPGWITSYWLLDVQGDGTTDEFEDIAGGYDGTGGSGIETYTPLLEDDGVQCRPSQRCNGSEFIEVSEHDDIQAGQSFAVEAWVKLDSEGQYDEKMFFARGTTEQTNRLVFAMGQSSINTFMAKVNVVDEAEDGGYRTVYVFSDEVEYGRWYHLAVTWTPGEGLKLYVNGELQGETEDEATETLTLVNRGFIGRSERGLGFIGNIMNVKVRPWAPDEDYFDACFKAVCDPSFVVLV